MTVATTEHGSTLALSAEQTYWTESQVAALRHIGVEKASEGDLTVFHHVCQRTGLDPFARQIYMIGRQTSEKGPDGNWVKVTKQTIQTGIDGFRLIGRRAADHAHHAVSVSAPEWAHEDGSWRPVWMKGWGYPVAARVTIQRAGEPFTAVALFDEYKQTKYGGDLTAMWEQRPAGQLAKCAEALAWRMAFPQDLSGIYTDDEMAQAENPRVTVEQERPHGLAAALAPKPSDAEAAPEDLSAPVEPVAPSASESAPITSAQLTKVGILCGELGLTDPAEARREVGAVIGREVKSRKDLTKDEASRVIERFTVMVEQPFPTEEPVDAEVVE